MINYDNYQYNERCVFKKQEQNEPLGKQLGDFGEQLVITMLGRIAKYSVAQVDHEGADLIAVDPESNKRYAISVKSAQFGPEESESKAFKIKDQVKLCVYAKEMDLIPAVAMIFIPRDFAFIDLYMVTLDHLRELADKGNKNAKESTIKFDLRTGGIRINNYALGAGESNTYNEKKSKRFKFLHNNEYIKHIRMDVHNRDNFLEGLHSCDDGMGVRSIQELVKEMQYKDGNLSRQLGDLGENLLMMLLGQQKGYKVSRVDHVGADLIATDKQGIKYAISVKTRQAESYTFNERYTSTSVKNPKRGLSKLDEFATKYNMIPVIAYLFIRDNVGEIDIYVSTLSNWIRKSKEENGKAVELKKMDDLREDIGTGYENVKTFKVNTTKLQQQEYLDNTTGIEHIKIKLDNRFDPTVKWE